MKVRLDHSLDPRFRTDLSEKLRAPVYTARFLDLHNFENGDMLSIAETHGITHTLTFDKNMRYQTNSPIAILALNEMGIATLRGNPSRIAAHLRSLSRGEARTVKLPLTPHKQEVSPKPDAPAPRRR